MDGKYTLNWSTFTDHLQLMFKDLYEEEKHSDVTLVCDDQTQFKAHKIVLSASSPVIKKFLMNFPSNNVIKTRIYRAMILTNQWWRSYERETFSSKVFNLKYLT